MRVVSGLLAMPDGRVLMGKRPRNKLRPSLYELPGGKVEDGESDERALAREWQEELGVAIRVIGGPLASSHMSVDVEIDIVLYRVDIVSGTPRAFEHEHLAWLCPSDAVRHWPCSPGFYVQYRTILDASGEVPS